MGYEGKKKIHFMTIQCDDVGHALSILGEGQFGMAVSESDPNNILNNPAYQKVDGGYIIYRIADADETTVSNNYMFIPALGANANFGDLSSISFSTGSIETTSLLTQSLSIDDEITLNFLGTDGFLGVQDKKVVIISNPAFNSITLTGLNVDTMIFANRMGSLYTDDNISKTRTVTHTGMLFYGIGIGTNSNLDKVIFTSTLKFECDLVTFSKLVVTDLLSCDNNVLNGLYTITNASPDSTLVTKKWLDAVLDAFPTTGTIEKIAIYNATGDLVASDIGYKDGILSVGEVKTAKISFDTTLLISDAMTFNAQGITANKDLFTTIELADFDTKDGKILVSKEYLESAIVNSSMNISGAVGSVVILTDSVSNNVKASSITFVEDDTSVALDTSLNILTIRGLSISSTAIAASTPIEIDYTITANNHAISKSYADTRFLSVNNTIGTLTNLSTTNKSDIVTAMNELFTRIGSGTGTGTNTLIGENNSIAIVTDNLLAVSPVKIAIDGLNTTGTTFNFNVGAVAQNGYVENTTISFGTTIGTTFIASLVTTFTSNTEATVTAPLMTIDSITNGGNKTLVTKEYLVGYRGDIIAFYEVDQSTQPITIDVTNLEKIVIRAEGTAVSSASAVLGFQYNNDEGSSYKNTSIIKKSTTIGNIVAIETFVTETEGRMANVNLQDITRFVSETTFYFTKQGDNVMCHGVITAKDSVGDILNIEQSCVWYKVEPAVNKVLTFKLRPTDIGSGKITIYRA